MKKMFLFLGCIMLPLMLWGQNEEIINIRGLEIAASGYGLIETQPHQQIDTLSTVFKNYYARMALWVLVKDASGDNILYSGEPVENGHNFIPSKPVADTVNFLGMDRAQFTKMGTYQSNDQAFRIVQYHFASGDKDKGVIVFTIQYSGGLGDHVTVNAGLHLDFDVPGKTNIPTPNDDQIDLFSGSMVFYDSESAEGIRITSLTDPVLLNGWIRGEVKLDKSGIKQIMTTSMLGMDNNTGDFHGYIGTEAIVLQQGEATVLGYILTPYEKGLSKENRENVNKLKNNLKSFAVIQNLKMPVLDSNTPSEFELKQNYPNPFNPVTKIEFSLKNSGQTELTIYNALGQKIRSLVNRYLVAGSYSIHWDGKDDQGQQVASGIYIYRLRQGDMMLQKKMVLVR